jgi:DNA polymerase I-like protein with 3'-5' exonuclease and polymerase domains
MKWIAKYDVDGTTKSTLKECLIYCKDKEWLGLDIETSVNEEYRHLQTKIHKGGLDPYLSNIVLLQIGDLEEQFVIDVRDYSKKELQPLLDFMHLNDEVTFVGQNCKFEVKHLLHKYGILFSKLHDTMISEIILYNGEDIKLGLADLAVKYLSKRKAESFDLFNAYASIKVSLDEKDLDKEGYISPFELVENQIIDKSTRLEFINIADKPVTYKQIEYAANDITDPILIASIQRKGRRLKNGELFRPQDSFNLENKFVCVLGEMELFGMEFNPAPWKVLAEKNLKEQTRVQRLLTNYVNENHKIFAGQYDLFTGEVECKIHWTSSKQVVEFFRYLGVCPRAFSKQTKRVEDTVGAKDIIKQLPLEYVGMYSKMKEVKEIVTVDDFQLMYIIFKKYEQLSTTFGLEWLKYIHPLTGKIHPSFVQLVSTGRLACRAPNMQQLPNSVTGHRACFSLSETSDSNLLVSDFSNMEVRCLADASGDENMLNFLNDGQHPLYGADFHSYSANRMEQAMYGDKARIVQPKELIDGTKNPEFTAEDGEKRSASKAFTFGLAFGKGIKAFASDLRISEEETEVFLNSYYNSYPKLQPWFNNQHKLVEENGYILIEKLTDFRWFDEGKEDREDDLKKATEAFGKDYKYMKTTDKRVRREGVFISRKDIRELWRGYWQKRSANSRISQNFPVQGTASRIAKCSALFFRQELIKKGVYITNVNFSNMVHDEFVINYSPTKLALKEEIARDLELSMERGGKVFNKKVKHIGECNIGKDWAH